MFKDNGELTTNMKDKVEIFLKYYQDLYRSETEREERIASLHNSVNMPELRDKHRIALDAPISLEEIYLAITNLKCNTSPGPDSLIHEFYIKFKHILAIYLHELFTSFSADDRIPASWQLEKIVVLPKPDKELRYPEAYRLISLLNINDKIFASVLSTRLNKFLTCYIHKDQGGFFQYDQLCTIAQGSNCLVIQRCGKSI